MKIKPYLTLCLLLSILIANAQEKPPALLSKAISKDNALLTRIALLIGNDKNHIHYDRSMICNALLDKKLNAAKVLAKRNAKIIHKDSEPFIFLLIKNRNTEGLKLLLTYYNYKDSLNSRNQTPIHYCLSQNSSPAFSFNDFYNGKNYVTGMLIPLLEANVKIDTSLFKGWSSYFLASDLKNETAKNLLFSTKLDYPNYEPANTGINVPYLSEDEKKVLYYINLVRMQPSLFAETYLHTELKKNMSYYMLGYLAEQSDSGEAELSYNYNDTILPVSEKTLFDSCDCFASLNTKLISMKPLPALQPDEFVFSVAKTKAIKIARTGKPKHTGLEKLRKYSASGEAFAYGSDDMKQQIITLLTDCGISDYGHRRILLSKKYNRTGVAVRQNRSGDKSLVIINVRQD